MAKYEKRNIKKIKPDKPQKNFEKPVRSTEKIEMKQVKSKKLPKKTVSRQKPETKAVRQREKQVRLTVVKGNKKTVGRTILSMAAVLLVIGLVIAVAAVTPTGVPETISNALRVMESGDGFPQTLSGEEVLLAKSDSNVTYVLSDMYLETYNSSGANLINFQHGFSNAALRTSSARALVFDRGGTNCKIFNFGECIFEESFNDRIMAADISRNGSAAFALNTDDHASRVEIYNKDFSRLYTWNSANEIISAVALCEDGSRVAVAAFRSVNGEYLSSLYIFEYNSATPVFSKKFDGEMILSLYSDSTAVWAVTQSGVYRTAWKDYSAKDTVYPYGVDAVCHSGKSFAAVTSSAENSLESTVEFFDKNGLSVVKIPVAGEADGLCIGKECIYVLINENVFAYDFAGALIEQIDVGYGVKYITEIKKGVLAAVSSKSIATHNLKYK